MSVPRSRSVPTSAITTTIDPEDGTISGEGRVYGQSQVSQNKLYFEVHVIHPGSIMVHNLVGEIRIGVADKSKEVLTQPLTDKKSYYNTQEL